MVSGYTKDSCIIVYVAPRYGRPVEPCLGLCPPNCGDAQSLERNRVKFGKNGCRRVDRDDPCNLKMIRG